MVNFSVNNQLKALRTTLSLNQTEFGKRLGVSRSVILNIELGKVEPKDIFLNHVCDVFSVRKEWLTEGTGDSFYTDVETKKQIDELWAMYSDLKPEFQEHIRQQINGLLQIQNK